MYIQTEMAIVTKQVACKDCEYYHYNDPDYPDNCEYPDFPPCLEVR